jgi:hypothetical protein
MFDQSIRNAAGKSNHTGIVADSTGYYLVLTFVTKANVGIVSNVSQRGRVVTPSSPSHAVLISTRETHFTSSGVSYLDAVP